MRNPRQRHTLEPLERRALLSVSVQVDYSLDANNFFADPLRRQLFQEAANDAVARLGDHLAAIVPGGGNTWTAIVDNPATGRNRDVNNLNIPADTILIYAGGREMSALGVGGPGGYDPQGSAAWHDLIATRGQGDTEGDDADDFGPWGGSVSFDMTPSGGWFFGHDAGNIPDHATDFYSVALHEVLHVLGFGTAGSWNRLVDESDGTFTGRAAAGEYDAGGNAVPLNPAVQRPSPQPDIPEDLAHWKTGTEDGGQEAAMDPELTAGMRKALTALDLAGLDDIGWDVPLTAEFTLPGNVTAAGAASVTFTVTYSHYTDVDAATIDGTDVTVSGPNGFAAAATLLGVTGSGRWVTATYAIDAPGGGAFDRDDSGTYSIALAEGAVGDRVGNFAAPRELGAFEVDIDSPPVATLAQEGKPQGGTSTHTLSVTYEDIHGVDAASVDAADITVTRAGGGLVLTVSGASFAPDANGGTARYTVDAPGGSWDPDDNGTYEVVLNADQVRDAGGVASTAGTLGAFDVSLGTIEFGAGRNATYVDGDGGTVVVSLTGPGTGRLVFDNPSGAASNLDASRLVLTGTSAASALTITATGAGTSLGGLTVDGPLKSLTGKNTDLVGVMTVAGPAPKVQLRNASGSISLDGGGGTPATITLAEARDLRLTSASPIKSLKVNDWLDTDGEDDVITTPALASLAVSGTLQAHVNAGSVGKVTAGGALDGAEIRAGGSIGSVTVGSASDSLVYAGVRSDVSALPDSLDDFANQAASIKSFTLKGRNASFSNTRIAAPYVGKAALGVAPLGTTAGNYYGLAADRITSVSGATPKGAFKLSKRNLPGTGTAMLDFAVVVL